LQALILIALAACGRGSDDTGPDDSPPAPGRWTVMVYMDGDNDLESYVIHDLNELEVAGSGDGVEIVVQADRAVGFSANGGDWTGTRRYHIAQDDDMARVASEVLEDLGEVDMADPASLADFLLWALERYPADHVAVVLWDHGTGWQLTSMPALPGVIWDEESQSELSIAGGDLQAGLQPLVDARGPIDVIAFDACNMAAWEVAHALKDQALAMAASEASVSMAGLQYDLSLARLRAEDLLAADLADDLARQAAEVGEERTFSATDLARVEALSGAIDALAGAALDDDEVLAALLDARAASSGTDATWPFWYLDLGSLTKQLLVSPHPALAAAGEDLDAALGEAVIGSYGNPPYAWAGGLNILFDPTWAEHLQLYREGEGATWSRDTRWDELLVRVAEE